MPKKPRVHKPRGQAASQRASRREAHRRYRQNMSPEAEQARRVRDSIEWQRCRASFRSRNPLCCDPLNLHPNRRRPTEQVHHIEGLKHRPDLAFNTDNLAPLCEDCHQRIEAMERRGEATAHLFKAGDEEVAQ